MAALKLQRLTELRSLQAELAERREAERRAAMLARASRPRRWASPLDMACQLDPTMVRTPALDLINDTLVDLAEGREDRLVISVPPQEGKSTLVSRWLPEWLLSDVDPDMRIIMISYSDEIARRWGADVKRDFETFNGDEGTVDLGVILRSDSRSAGRWQIEGRRGGMLCAGVAGSVTGRPAEVILIDDPIKDLEQAQSAAYRERFQRFWQGVVVPRLAPGARVCVIQTRWHEEDAAGWLIQNEGKRQDGGRWTVINIPAQAEDDNDPLGRQPGEYLISARGNRDWEGTKKSVGAYVWAALYQGRPAPAEGGLFKRIWWRYWTGHGNTLNLGGQHQDLRDSWRFITADLAASTKTSADWTVFACWARTISGDLVLLDRLRARIDEGQHFAHVRGMVNRYQVDTVFVEATHHTMTLVREATQHGIPITPLRAETDKFSRALPASAWVSSGRVWLPAGRPWLSEWVNELAAVPNGRWDDQADTLAYAVRVAVTQPAPHGSRPMRHPDRDPFAGALGGTSVDFATAAM